MNQDEINELKTIILGKIEDIQASMPYLNEETQAIAPSCSLGRLTRMEALSEKGVNEYVLEQNKQSLVKLQNALERIEKGSYGKCVRCGKEIPAGRLKLVPETLICVPCAEKKRR
ncbi:MAG: TraR/DksA C4-type zinc finger protein [Spirochaetales bacterium]|nr:TraR/DksA C4-type zinc finger protein [Spirochaetales bacterium]